MIWIKDNGQEIEINDLPASIEHCKSLGWTPKDEVKKEEKVTPAKKTAKKKAAKK